MKSSLIALPFLAFFLVIIGFASYSALTDAPWLAYFLWALGASIFGTWIIMERSEIKAAMSRRGTRYGASSGLNFLLALLIIVGLAFLSSRPRFDFSWDVTQDKLNTLSDQSLKIVEIIKDEQPEIEILGFFVDPMQRQNFTDLVSLYRNAGARLNLKYIDPQVDPTLAIAENVTTADTVILKNGPNEARLTNFTEERMTNALLNVLKTETKSVYFTVGHGERDLNDPEAEGFRLAKAELESERYQVQRVNLLERGEVPESADLLIIAGPQYDFRDSELEILRQHMNDGRPVLLMVDALVALPNLKAFFEDYGISFQDDMVAVNPNNPLARQPDWQYSALVTEFDEFSAVTSDFVRRGQIGMLMPFSRSLDVVEGNVMGMSPTMLARASDINVRFSNVTRPEDMRDIGQDRILPGNVGLLAYSSGQVGGSGLAEGEVQVETELDAKPLSETKASRELRLVVAGSSHFASNYGGQRPENMDMFLNIVSYLMQDEDFISIRPQDPSQSRLELTSGASVFNLIFFSFIYPFFFLGYGLVQWLRRRRK